jgi:Na+-driven multidrug efflux pump
MATWLVLLTGLYLTLGVLFAVPFAFRFINRIDAVAAHGTSTFRLLVIPGATLLWPMLLIRLLRGDTAPPMERTAHRSASR